MIKIYYDGTGHVPVANLLKPIIKMRKTELLFPKSCYCLLAINERIALAIQKAINSRRQV